MNRRAAKILSAVLGAILLVAFTPGVAQASTYELVRSQTLTSKPSASAKTCQSKSLHIAKGHYKYEQFVSGAADGNWEYFTLYENLPAGSYYWQTCIYGVTGYRSYNYKIFTTLTISGGSKSWLLAAKYFDLDKTGKYPWGSEIYITPV